MKGFVLELDDEATVGSKGKGETPCTEAKLLEE
jgi:hypothetical protein